MNEIRKDILSYLAAHVVGPFGGSNEVLAEQPHKRYLMGTLYPANATSDEILTEEVEESGGGSIGEELADDPITFANSWLPSSLGISFFLGGAASFLCDVWAGRYDATRVDKRLVFRRVAIAEPTAPEVVEVTCAAENGRSPSRTSAVVLDGRACIDVLWRPLEDGHLVTVTLRNTQQQDNPTQVDPERCLLQVGFRCTPQSGAIREYPSVTFLSRDSEEAELRLLHRDARVFAIGHGCAAQWSPVTDTTTATVQTELLPTFEVPALVTGGPDNKILALSRLSDSTLATDVLTAELTTFVDSYANWIDTLADGRSDIPASLLGARAGIFAKLKSTLAGMRRGIGVLAADPTALRAFRLANLAMLMQMRHARVDLAGERKARDTVTVANIDYTTLSYTWRPFQLAFQLLTLPSIASRDDQDRDVVDLLWFPTGGGKTEAYLAVAATQIFLRRLKSANAGAGTAVITRYTLRLLTAQQFQRAAALVCAAELLRRRHESEMGTEPISIGLWVGDNVTPNKYAKAAEKLADLFEDPFPSNAYSFQLDQCPWCGTSIVPDKRQDDETAYGVRATNSSFEFYCPTMVCPFHERLPVAVVDEELYKHPPTFLLATVDKFARLAWEERGGAFFGGGGHEPPSLVIQDEMHLLSGPLGTTVGVYEAAIEALMTFNGARPKIVASTATIRRADRQVLGLFGREVRVFPPAGLEAGDSYFAKTDRSKPGRLYVGLMSQSHTPHTTIVHAAAALLQAPIELGLTGAELDAYWTMVAYHNSLRELGRTVTLARDDIPARIKVIAQDQSRLRELGDDAVVELTSNVSGFALPAILDRLDRRVDEMDSVSLLASTNMLSVGIDIPRLGLMLVNGQPKTTSEYIQASSRVGRSNVPGLVLTLYVSTKPRDRSHYEGFIPYHAALYRHVEPSSVTPFSLPSRERALHAALVILIRHGVGLSANEDASAFAASDPAVQHAIRTLEERVMRIDPVEYEPTSRQLRLLAETWEATAAVARSENRKLYYQASKPHQALLKNFGDDGDGWPTLHSMRNVDRQCTLTVIGEDK